MQGVEKAVEELKEKVEDLTCIENNGKKNS